MTKGETVTKQLQRAIAESGHSLYRIAKETDVPYATIWRFANDKADLRLETVDKLAFFLRLWFTERPSTKDFERTFDSYFQAATRKPTKRKGASKKNKG